MRVLLAQINPKVGDIDGNIIQIEGAMDRAKRCKADLVVFPEMAVCGYPPKDLLLRDSFVRRCESAVQRLVDRRFGVAAIVGTVTGNNDSYYGPGLFNTAVVIGSDGDMHQYHKRLLPTYDVFDESRYFSAGESTCVVDICGRKVGVTICEDMWGVGVYPSMVSGRAYGMDPVAQTVKAGADMVVNISASPFSVGKQAAREGLMQMHSNTNGVPFVYVNQVGANDDLVFDGASVVVTPDADLIRAEPFSEHLLMVEVGVDREATVHPYPSDIESVRQALVLGVRDYYRKSGFFKGVVVGLSGGIDSAVTAAIAVEALGAGKVYGVSMPSKHSSGHSEDDAKALADSLGIDYRTIPIESTVAAMEAALATSFKGMDEDVTEENIQARIRGDILMSLSNKFGWLVLTTGNKSELSVGYCTLYGDMCGGLAVISDVPKTMVFELAKHINEIGRRETVRLPIIPDNTITKPPSAELRAGQVDQDTLPPYPLLDTILEEYVENNSSPDEIATRVGETDWVGKVVAMVDRNEYKRRQAAPGLRVTTRAFGHGWRMPIVASHR